MCGGNVTLEVFADNLSPLDSTIAGFCEDSASVPREFIAQLDSNSTLINASMRDFCDEPPRQLDTDCNLESELRV